MGFAITELLGCEFPLFAFSHCRDVVCAVSRAGGFGVLGAASFSPEGLDQELAWIDAHCDGKPYGVDILVPNHQAVTSGVTPDQLAGLVPKAHREFVTGILEGHGLAGHEAVPVAPRLPGSLSGEQLMDVAFKYPIRLIVNALGVAPPSMIERARAHGVPVGALVGTGDQARKQADAGVEVIVAQGGEAGGHCGEVSTIVLIPEVLRALDGRTGVHVLAAGGIMTGAQMAGVMAMGAAGAWTGSIWLATSDAETSPVFREKMIAASSRDTVRSVYRTGKPSRQLRSEWHDAWDHKDAPAALPMPLMSVVSEPAFRVIDRASDAGDAKARSLMTYFVGQGVGLVEQERSATEVVQSFKTEFADAAMSFITMIENSGAPG